LGRLGASRTRAARRPAPSECEGNDAEQGGEPVPGRENSTSNRFLAVGKLPQHVVEVMMGLGLVQEQAPSDPTQKFGFLCLELRLREHVGLPQLAQLVQLFERVRAGLER
jgi:hypothetical protein